MTGPAAPPEPLRKRWLTELLLVIYFLTVLAWLVGVMQRRRPVAATERQAISTLQELAAAQEQFRQAGLVSQDGDARGEYGYLQELAGVATPRGTQAAVESAFVRDQLGKMVELGDVSAATSGGYHFLVYLPDGLGGWCPESRPLPQPRPEVAQAQEGQFIIYAWPVRVGYTGERAFAITSRGALLATDNYGFQGYSGADHPPPDAVPEVWIASVGVDTGGFFGPDGFVWDPITR